MRECKPYKGKTMSNPIEVKTSRIWFQEAMKWINTEEGKGWTIGEAIMLLRNYNDPTKTDDEFFEHYEEVKRRGTKVIVTD